MTVHKYYIGGLGPYLYGVKLDRGTKQKFCVTIRDDCTDADLFNCQAFGFERIE